MKLEEIKPMYEMTMHGGSSRSDADMQQDFQYMDQHGTHVGDQDQLPIVRVSYNGGVVYGIKEDGKTVSLVTFMPKGDMLEMGVAHTLAPNRGQNHFKRILWFVKEQEGKSIIDHGVQTDAGRKAIQSLSRSGRFRMWWFNTNTGEKVEYDHTTDDKDNSPYRAISDKTPWRVMIERADTPSLDRYYNGNVPFFKGNHWILFEGKKPSGTYACYHFAPKSLKALREWAKKNEIPNRVPHEKMHCTLLFSKKHCPDYEPKGELDPPIEVKPKHLTVFDSRDRGKKVLVVELDAPEFTKRHKELMKEHGATYDFPEYKPHVTLSYDMGDLDIDTLPDISKDIPTLEAIEEFGEDLVEDWNEKK